ncbi:hypothetical protein SAMN04487752_1194 [Carnobacterium viridans]|uniref:Uncharacterized protein n=1 Tax=Carnobacterium viridans TaxID=174587 RepID=A0A1H0XII1_9LACT|nr:hypothetical protein SAMN04487752_0267 [Carnobacterium viridans]SDQ19543.1 hypothetical protein SAMN04487752_1194 [Carnobacterium viridans]
MKKIAGILITLTAIGVAAKVMHKYIEIEFVD